MTVKYRVEHDSMGELQVPESAAYGAQTQRAVNNFQISSLKMPRRFIQALGLIKAACAEANTELGLLPKDKAQAIVKAGQQIAAGDYDQEFPVDVFQTGSGTSSNMNTNEVIAHLSRQDNIDIHPNDHVNMGQSSNDVIPTAIQVSAAVSCNEDLLPSLLHLEKTLSKKANSLKNLIKTGRTHLMDAMPLRFDQELSAFARQIENARAGINDTLTRLTQLAQGGTAIGTGINAHPDFGALVASNLAKSTKVAFKTSSNYFERINAQDTSCELSGQLKVLACALMKISNDLRWMNSGPLAGLGEIELPALQPGSSIMPGKVNPVIPEAVTMVCAQVIGNDSTITIAAQSGNFQLNVMLPVVGYNLLQSIEILSHASRALADKAIEGFRVRKENLQAALSRNPILVTALNSVIGYEQGAAIAKQAYKEGRAVIEVALEMTNLSKEQLEELLDPAKLTEGGISSK